VPPSRPPPPCRFAVWHRAQNTSGLFIRVPRRGVVVVDPCAVCGLCQCAGRGLTPQRARARVCVCVCVCMRVICWLGLFIEKDNIDRHNMGGTLQQAPRAPRPRAGRRGLRAPPPPPAHRPPPFTVNVQAAALRRRWRAAGAPRAQRPLHNPLTARAAAGRGGRGAAAACVPVGLQFHEIQAMLHSGEATVHDTIQHRSQASAACQKNQEERPLTLKSGSALLTSRYSRSKYQQTAGGQLTSACTSDAAPARACEACSR
jgi:hypothetical protein